MLDLMKTSTFDTESQKKAIAAMSMNVTLYHRLQEESRKKVRFDWVAFLKMKVRRTKLTDFNVRSRSIFP